MALVLLTPDGGKPHLQAAAKPAAPTPTPTVSTAPPPSSYRVVALGDSVPAGSRCSCPAFPELYAKKLARRAKVPVRVRNLGAPGQTSAGLLASLRTSSTARAVASADIVTITIGANDFTFSTYLQHRRGTLSCYAPALRRLRGNLSAILDMIRLLHSNVRRQTILVTGYWDIWRDGAVGRESGPTYMRVGDAMTRRVNEVISSAAEEAADDYVDLFAPFRGTAGDRDDTGLLASDGDHPNQAGHELIAAELVRQGGAQAVDRP
jgi:lysophospholipase L1-like esterase